MSTPSIKEPYQMADIVRSHQRAETRTAGDTFSIRNIYLLLPGVIFVESEGRIGDSLLYYDNEHYCLDAESPRTDESGEQEGFPSGAGLVTFKKHNAGLFRVTEFVRAHLRTKPDNKGVKPNLNPPSVDLVADVK